jgi:hypothetical protein
MSRVSISRSYAVLVGLEAYVKTRRKVKHGVQHASNAETRVLHPDEYHRIKEEEKDKSKSAEKERKLLAANAQKEQAERKEKSWKRRVWSRIRFGSVSSKEEVETVDHRKKKTMSKKGQDVEAAIAPSGRRDRVGVA